MLRSPCSGSSDWNQTRRVRDNLQKPPSCFIIAEQRTLLSSQVTKHRCIVHSTRVVLEISLNQPSIIQNMISDLCCSNWNVYYLIIKYLIYFLHTFHMLESDVTKFPELTWVTQHPIRDEIVGRSTNRSSGQAAPVQQWDLSLWGKVLVMSG